MAQVELVINKIDRPVVNSSKGIFLAGAPVFFPYLKIAEVIEQAGMAIVVDELCTSERVMVSSTACDEKTEYGILKALGEKSHLACSCPSYIDNDHRIENILSDMKAHNIKGVVYHQLKGCHLYDIDSFKFEKAMKQNGFNYIKIETDFSQEDRQNILTRLEAFREIMD